ncbi:hypothetical protein [Nonomuraea sp. NPDC050202]|jgi:hypothetical protein|uniref:hypothetical protein n=1 Tax=Nonomuraea sp. NPDC050202 TaxID=3155035 RepID=UPI0033C5AB41
MGFEGDVWRLVRRGELVGTITIEDADQPWLNGRFVAGPAFGEFEPLFSQELALLDHIDEDYEAWEAVHGQITSAVQLVAPHGPVPEFLLHVQDDRAWFRWSDEPFVEE